MGDKSRTRLIRKFLLAGLGIVTVLGFLAWMQIMITSSASSLPTLDDQTLETKAISWAQSYGLQGAPVAKRSARMALGQWLALGGGQLSEGAARFGLSSDVPVFVLAMRGRVEWRGLGLLPPGQVSGEQFDNITIALDARDGNLISAGAARSASAMPVQVPLNALTPTVPIIFVATQPPSTPPTLAPRVTATRTIPVPTPTTRPYP